MEKVQIATVALLVLFLFEALAGLPLAIAKSEEEASKCVAESAAGGCRNKARAMRLNYIAIAAILVASMVGVSLPLFSRSVPALRPDKRPFLFVRSFASGVIVATGFMHVMPDSWNDLTSPCLPTKPWKVFPFTPFITMVSAYLTMMMDTLSTGYYEKKRLAVVESGGTVVPNNINGTVGEDGDKGQLAGGHGHHLQGRAGDKESQLLKDRVVAQVLELGIVVHSVVIGLSMGASDNPCTIRPLVAAICFHQLFEGMGLGGCILQAQYKIKMKGVMVLFFSVTTPLGIGMGMALSNVYDENSPTALVVVGVLNAVAAGLLIYMAMVDLLAADFKGPHLQTNLMLQLSCYGFALLGTGCMSVMALWA